MYVAYKTYNIYYLALSRKKIADLMFYIILKVYQRNVFHIFSRHLLYPLPKSDLLFNQLAHIRGNKLERKHRCDQQLEVYWELACTINYVHIFSDQYSMIFAQAAWNQPCWEYLQHGNWQTLSILPNHMGEKHILKTYSPKISQGMLCIKWL